MTTLSRTAVFTIAAICWLGLSTAATADRLIGTGVWSNPAIWDTGSIPDNVPGDWNDNVFLWKGKTVTLDADYNYNQIGLYIGYCGTAGTLNVPGNTSATFSACCPCEGYTAAGDGATINITGGSLTCLGNMDGPKGGMWSSKPEGGYPATLGVDISAGTLTVGGGLLLNSGGHADNVSNISVFGTGIMDLGSVTSNGGTVDWTVGDLGKVIIDGDHRGDPTLGGLLHGADGWGLDAAFDGTETSIWAVPEPAGVVLLASGCVVALLLGLRRRHRTRFSTGGKP